MGNPFAIDSLGFCYASILTNLLDYTSALSHLRFIRGDFKVMIRCLCFHLVLLSSFLLTTAGLSEPQSTFGPTPDLIAQVRQVGFDAFLADQLAAPMTDYPELPFWPQTRPTSCTGDCQRDNYTYYQLQRHFFTNALYGQGQLRPRVAFALGHILVTSQTDIPFQAGCAAISNCSIGALLTTFANCSTT